MSLMLLFINCLDARKELHWYRSSSTSESNCYIWRGLSIETMETCIVDIFEFLLISMQKTTPT